jgi:hypothetical protein
MHEHTETVHTMPAHTAETMRTTRTATSRFSLSDVLSLIGGAALIVIGAVVLLRGDISGAWSDPVVRVVGLTHTPLLGIIEVSVGVLLVLAGLASSRTLTLAVSVGLIAFGAIVVAEHASLSDDLAVTAAHGWWAIGIGAVLLIAAVAVPAVRRTSVVEVADSADSAEVVDDADARTIVP